MSAGAVWTPGMPIEGKTQLRGPAAALAFVQGDTAYVDITELLIKRGCSTIDDWCEWDVDLFNSVVRAGKLTLSKDISAYRKGMERAFQHDLVPTDTADRVLNLLADAKKPTGGDVTLKTAKVKCSDTFVASQWVPDASVYEGVPKAKDVKFLEDEEEKLYMDKLWLNLQARC